MKFKRGHDKYIYGVISGIVNLLNKNEIYINLTLFRFNILVIFLVLPIPYKALMYGIYSIFSLFPFNSKADDLCEKLTWQFKDHKGFIKASVGIENNKEVVYLDFKIPSKNINLESKFNNIQVIKRFFNDTRT